VRTRAALAVLAAAAASCGTPLGPASPGWGGWNPVAGPCGAETPLEPGMQVTASTETAAAQLESRCGAGGKGPELTYAFALERPARVRLELLTDTHDGALHMRAGCGDPAPEIACNEDAGGPRRSLIVAQLEPGPYVVVVDGSGPKDAGPFSLGFEVYTGEGDAAPNDICEEPQRITPGQGRATIHASTFSAADDHRPPCTSSPGGPDVYYAIDLQEPSLVTAAVEASDFSSPVLALAPACSGPWTACGVEVLAVEAGAGVHVLAVDSLGADLVGDLTVSLHVQPLAGLEAACMEAADLPLGETTEGETSGTDMFTAGCADETAAPESVFRLSLVKRTRVGLRLNSKAGDAVLHVRSNCMDPGSEVACNDDHGGKNRSEVDVVLDAGTYYVFVDGHAPGDAGAFSLEAWTTPLAPP
jgi:hypothetical protein